ncbi:MAG TPA: acyltransferase family protein [Acidimicrobiales bacterium]|nr:acyltransferase family protein [Acidimicrobiales bacterium]
MPRPVEGDSRYLPGLDGIRAIAVLAVIAYHLNFSWAKGGLLGVGVFFVLSGYLITDLLASEYKRRGGIRLGQFWLKRARRLLPALLVMLFVVTGWITLFDRSQLTALRSDLIPGIFYYSNWWFIFQHVSYFAQFGPPSPLGHLWSLAIEEQFYLIWPFVVLAGMKWVHSRRTQIVIVLCAAVASAVEMAVLFAPFHPTRVYEGTDTRVFALLIGAALALALPRSQAYAKVTAGARRLLDTAGVVALLGIFAMFWLTTENGAFLYRGGLVLLSLLTAVLIAVVVHPGARLGLVLGKDPLRWIGERSYGIYLWHYPVIVLTTPNNAPPNLLRATLQFAASIGLAALSWKFIEQPVRHGALGRAWQRVRRHQWTWQRLTPLEWAVGGVISANVIVCTVGLSGAVAGPPPQAETSVTAVTPPVHRTTTTTTVTPASTTTVPGQTTVPTTTAPPPPPGQGVLAIGDSIMIDVKTDLQAALPGINIDAYVGQQLVQALDDVPTLKADGDVGNRLVLELGTNGPFTATQLKTLLNQMGPPEKIVLINTRVPRPWQTTVNNTIDAVARTYPNATVLNWYAASAGHPTWFYTDGIHLNPTGAKQLATLIVQALSTPPPTTTTTTTTTAPRATTTTKAKGRSKGTTTTQPK